MTIEELDKRQQELDETRVNLLAQLNSLVGAMNENAHWMKILKDRESVNANSVSP